jgi:hypothetical protein
MSASVSGGFEAAELLRHLTVVKFVNGCPKTILNLEWLKIRDSSLGIATGYGVDDPVSIPDMARLFSTASRPALGPTQPPIKSVLGLFPRRQSGHDLATHLHQVPMSRKVELYHHHPIHYGIVFNCRSR